MVDDIVTELRSDFAEFEALLLDGEALEPLKDAIAIYHEIAGDPSTTNRDREVARNVLNAHARKFLSEADTLFGDPRAADYRFHEYWANMAMQFVELQTEYEDEIRQQLVEFLVTWSRLVPIK